VAHERRHPNFVIAHQLWDGIALGDAPTLRSVLAEDSVWRMCGRSPLAGTYVGVDAILDFMARVGELTDELQSELLDVYVGDEGGVIRYAIHAARGSQHLDTEQIFLFRAHGGRIVDAVLSNLDPYTYDRFFLPQ
jgi:ketosteroid isomerase-like protein